MSMQIEFEPHSWYRGFAIKHSPLALDKWLAYTDDGMVTYDIIELTADTLRELKTSITEYRNREAERWNR